MTAKKMKIWAWLIFILIIIMATLAVLSMNYILIVIASIIELPLWGVFAYLISAARVKQNEPPKNILSLKNKNN